LEPGQSVTGSSHCQSTLPVAQAVLVASQAEGVVLPVGVSQQCCVPGVQYSFLPPSPPLNGQ
jgi:hypothetical protein